MPVLEDTLHEMKDSKSVHHGRPVEEILESASKLTTFQTCFGCYRWLHLPFALSVSAEIFHRRLLQTFSDHPDVICIADDVVVHGKNREHDTHLKTSLRKCRDVGIRLNKKKLELARNKNTFVDHRMTTDELQAE